MGDKKEKIQKARMVAKARVILFLTLIIVLVGVAIGMFRMHKGLSFSDKVALERTARGVKSIPGSQNPTLQYRALQKHQNISNANLALKEGDSSISRVPSDGSKLLGRDTISSVCPT